MLREHIIRKADITLPSGITNNNHLIFFLLHLRKFKTFSVIAVLKWYLVNKVSY